MGPLKDSNHVTNFFFKVRTSANLQKHTPSMNQANTCNVSFWSDTPFYLHRLELIKVLFQASNSLSSSKAGACNLPYR